MLAGMALFITIASAVGVFATVLAIGALLVYNDDE